MKLFGDQNDYPLPLHRRAVRSLLFKSGLLETIGRPVWRETSIAPYISEHDTRRVDMFAGMPTRFEDEVVSDRMTDWTRSWTPFLERRWEIDNAIVEPNRCLVIGPDGRLVSQSRRSKYLPQFPNAIGYLLARSSMELEDAIVYDGRQSGNYYHHVVDGLINLVFFLERSSLDRSIPLIVNRWIYESRFFRDLRERSPTFARQSWVVQEANQWIRVKRAHLLQAAPFASKYWQSARKLYPAVGTTKGKRLFVSRDRRMFGRGLRNESEVVAMLSRYGFETIYAEHLTLIEQQRAFEECEVLVALHGMAMIQQMFMTPETAVVMEIMPRDRIQGEYPWQAWALGLRAYDMILGSQMDGSGQYTVDVGNLERRLRSLLERSEHGRVFGATDLSIPVRPIASKDRASSTP